MEERKKTGPLGRICLVLLALVLAAACYLAADLPDLTLGLGPWGVYSTDGGSLYLTAAYLETDPSDLLVTDRRLQPEDGQIVTYMMDGRRTVDHYDDVLGHAVLAGEGSTVTGEAVVYILRDGNVPLSFLREWRWCIWGFTAGLFLTLLVMKLTANTRWKKRQQKLMLKNFRTYGEKYAQEDEELDY